MSELSALRAGPVATAILAASDGHIVQGDRRWPDLLAAAGRTPTDVAGRPWEAWWFGDPRDREAFAEVARSRDACALHPFTTEQRGRRTVWDPWLIPTPALEPPAVLLACADVTDAALGHERLEEQARAHEELLAHASHELRGPLAPLTTWTEVLRRMFEASVRDAEWDRQATRVVASFERQIRVLTQRLDDLFVIAQLERGVALEPQTLELGVLLETLANAIRNSAGSPPVRVVREPSAGGRIVADATWLSRAIQSLAADLWVRNSASGEIALRASSAGAAPRIARIEVSVAGDDASGSPATPGAERARERKTQALAWQLARMVAERHDGRAGVEGDDLPQRYWIEIPLT
jgi:signal transduction histidine kinase